MSKDLKKFLETINRRIGQKITKGERETAKRYATILTEIRAVTAQLYERYEVDGKLTWADLQKYDRFNKYKLEVQHLLKTHYKELNKFMPGIIGDVYEEGYYLTAYGVESAASVKLAYSAIASETMTAMVQNPVSGLTLSETLERNRVNIIYKIQQEVTQGLTKGETYGTMSKRLKTSLEGDAEKAMKIVRTEGHRVQESSKLDAVAHANKQGVIMKKTWNTLEDSRVRRKKANHAQLNNVTKNMDENFSDGLGEGPGPGQLGAAGSDINCRCFLTYEIDRIEPQKKETVENLTFEQWKEERLRK